MWQETEFLGSLHQLETQAATATRERVSFEQVGRAAEVRAAGAEQALASAQRRNAEQETALANLQAVLEQLQLQVHGAMRVPTGLCRGTDHQALGVLRLPVSQAAGPGDEASQLRVGGRLLELELRRAESDLDAVHMEQQSAEGALRSALAESSLLHDEVSSLQALLRSAQAAQTQDTAIDKRLAASVLVKYFERRSTDVLVVLASMLGCTPDEQRALGLLPRAALGSPTQRDAKLSDMWIVRQPEPLPPPPPPPPHRWRAHPPYPCARHRNFWWPRPTVAQVPLPHESRNPYWRLPARSPFRFFLASSEQRRPT